MNHVELINLSSTAYPRNKTSIGLEATDLAEELLRFNLYGLIPRRLRRLWINIEI